MKRAAALLGIGLSLAAPAARAQSDVIVPAGHPAVGRPAIVSVLDAGRGPKRPLRYTVPADYRARMNMDMTMSMAASVDGATMPAMALPTIRASADVAVTGVSPTGEITYALSSTAMSLPNGDEGDLTAMAFAALNADFRKITATATISDRGIVNDLQVDTSRAFGPQLNPLLESLRVSLNSLSVPLPNETVGLGARWQVRLTANLNSVIAFQTLECELTALDTTSATIETRLLQKGPPQPVDDPSLPKGANAFMESMLGLGSGTIQVAFAELVPVSVSELKNTVNMAVTGGVETERMSFATTMRTEVRPAQRTDEGPGTVDRTNSQGRRTKDE